MKKIAIMQPYFFPYIGYFLLINQADKFIFFDTPQYIRRGWVNRNRILKSKTDITYITVPVKKSSRDTTIMNTEIDYSNNWRETILGQLVFYKKLAPNYNNVIDLVKSLLENKVSTISELNIYTTIEICKYLNIDSSFDTFSQMSISLPKINEPDEWALYITKELGYQIYLNPPGGISFFDVNKYTRENIELQFLKATLEPYIQKIGHFESGLSILDIMMFNSEKEIKSMLNNFEVI